MTQAVKYLQAKVRTQNTHRKAGCSMGFCRPSTGEVDRSTSGLHSPFRQLIGSRLIEKGLSQNKVESA